MRGGGGGYLLIILRVAWNCVGVTLSTSFHEELREVAWLVFQEQSASENQTSAAMQRVLERVQEHMTADEEEMEEEDQPYPAQPRGHNGAAHRCEAVSFLQISGLQISLSYSSNCGCAIIISYSS